MTQLSGGLPVLNILDKNAVVWFYYVSLPMGKVFYQASPSLSSENMGPFPGANTRPGACSQPGAGSPKMMDSPTECPQGSFHILCRPAGSHNRHEFERIRITSGIQNNVGYLKLQGKEPQHEAFGAHSCQTTSTECQVFLEGNHVLIQPGSHGCIHKQPRGNKECSFMCRSNGDNRMGRQDSPFPKDDTHKRRAEHKDKLAQKMQSRLKQKVFTLISQMFGLLDVDLF